MKHVRTTLFLLLGAAPASAQWSTETLSLPRWGLAATSVADKALFAGGSTCTSGLSAVVDIYDATSDSWSTAALSRPRVGLQAASAGGFALFAGDYTTLVDVYEASTGTWRTASLSIGRGFLAAAASGNKVFFAGGETDGALASDVVDIYDAAQGPPSDPGAWTTATLSHPRYSLSATAVGDKVLFAGGWDDSAASDVVDIYNMSTGSWSTAHLSYARAELAATTAGTQALFAGGPCGSWDVVDIYDDSTGVWSTAVLSQSRSCVATSLGDKAIFAGGDTAGCGPHGGSAASDTVDIYDSQTGVWSTTRLQERRRGLAATSVVGRALFAGGLQFKNAWGCLDSSLVDVYAPLGRNYCSANLNSTGLPALMNATGSDVVADNDVTLTASQMPPNQFGYFLTSETQGFVPNPGGSNGNLCLGGVIGRYQGFGQSSGPDGTFSLQIDLTLMPTSPPQVVLPGETWNFQAWFRDQDPGNTSNFTDGLSITFM